MLAGTSAPVHTLPERNLSHSMITLSPSNPAIRLRKVQSRMTWLVESDGIPSAAFSESTVLPFGNPPKPAAHTATYPIRQNSSGVAYARICQRQRQRRHRQLMVPISMRNSVQVSNAAAAGHQSSPSVVGNFVPRFNAYEH